MSEEEHIIIYDIESGWPHKVSKQEHDSFLALWEAARPVLKTMPVPGLLIFGTVQSSDETRNLFELWKAEQLFKNPNNE